MSGSVAVILASPCPVRMEDRASCQIRRCSNVFVNLDLQVNVTMENQSEI